MLYQQVSLHSSLTALTQALTVDVAGRVSFLYHKSHAHLKNRVQLLRSRGHIGNRQLIVLSLCVWPMCTNYDHIVLYLPEYKLKLHIGCLCLPPSLYNPQFLGQNILQNIHGYKVKLGGPRWCSWLRHCATSQKVAGSILDGVIGILNWHNPSGRTMALGSTQPLTEMSTGNISWGLKKAGA